MPWLSLDFYDDGVEHSWTGNTFIDETIENSLVAIFFSNILNNLWIGFHK
jgi:hypothetical protein